MKVAIIPAREGSKRIPRKNIKLFAGRPIIEYSIKAGIGTGLFDKVIVSTDSKQIGNVARRYGAEVPFIRPSGISDDHTMLPPVLKHALDWLNENAAPVECFCCILPTAPFIRPEYIRQGYEKLIHEKVSAVISVTTFPFPIFRAFKISEGKRLEMLWPEHEFTRSNDLEEVYHDAGQFYWLDTAKFCEQQRIFAPDASPILLPRYMVQDIDTPEDWQTAEHMYLAMNRHKPGRGKLP